MAKLAPTTDGHLGNPNGWEAVGYDSRHTSIEGFANFHEFQVGGVVVAPTVGELQTVPGPLDNPDAGYRSRFDKKDEVARPGYYSVLLKDYGVKAELTATERVGFHRYTFPATEEANLIFNIGTRMGESGPVRDASVTYTDDGRIEGWVVTEPAYVDIYQKGATVTMYFSAVLDAEPAAWGAFSGRANLRGGAQPHRRRSRALPAFRHPRASAGGAEDRPVVHVGGERAAEPRKGGRQERFRPGAPRGERHVGRGAGPASRRGRPAR